MYLLIKYKNINNQEIKRPNSLEKTFIQLKKREQIRI